MIQIPPQDAARAACALLLGLCCFLLLSLLPPPGPPICPAAAGLRLLSSPSFLFFLRPSLPASLPVCFLVCRLLPLFCLASCCVCSCLVLLVCSSRFVVGLVGCACCQLTKVTKDCRGLPAPTSHTHTPPQ